MTPQIVQHPDFGGGTLLKTYKGGFEWEVQFDSGRRFRLPAKEFNADSQSALRHAVPRSFLRQRPVILKLEQFGARQTLEALRVGIVPVQDAEKLTIGLEAERITLSNAFDRSRERGGDVIAVIGDYGFGKSHFIELAVRRGLHENFIITNTSLDLMETPPGKAHKIYQALVASMRYSDTQQRGLAPLIRKALDHPTAIQQFVALCPGEVKDCPLTSTLLALQDCPSQQAFDEIILWLSGQTKAQAEMKTCFKKPPRLYVMGETARQYSYLLTGLSLLSTLVGYSGMAVLIDESEHYSLLPASQRERADSFFKSMIVGALGVNNGRIHPRDIPNNPRIEYSVSYAAESHLLFLFTLTESAERMPVGTWLAPSHLVRLDDRFVEKNIREFFVAIARYHGSAYGYVPKPERYKEIVIHAPKHLYRALAQHRINLRQLIRGAVSVYDLLYLHPDYAPDALLDELQHGLKV